MRGLRTQEDDSFQKFFGIVQSAADELGCVFFLDTGEGREFDISGIKGEDLSGWLLPKDKADGFEKIWEKFKPIPSDTDDAFYRFASWADTGSGHITITFSK